MADVLCFGDSNTWGYNPKDGSRFPWGVRWTSVLQEQLKDQENMNAEGHRVFAGVVAEHLKSA